MQMQRSFQATLSGGFMGNKYSVIGILDDVAVY
jgi:hypothetical protein